MKKYYQESLDAEKKCNLTVSGPLSPVEESKKTRTITKEKLDASKDKTLRALAAQNKSLTELQEKAHDLGKKVHHLSHKAGVFNLEFYSLRRLIVWLHFYRIDFVLNM